MVGDVAERASRAVGGALVERLGDAEVELGAPARGEAVVERAPHQLVGEPVRKRVTRHLLDHAAGDAVVKRRGQGRGVEPARLADHVGLELRARDRGQLQHGLRRGVEPREPLAHDVAHAVRRVERRQRPGQVGAWRRGAGLDQRPPHLGEQERVPAREHEHRLGQRGQALEGSAARLAYELLDVFDREAGQPHPGDLLAPAQVDERVAELLRDVGLGVAERRDDQQAGVGGGPAEVPEQEEGRVVGPVPVLEHEQHGPAPARRDQELDDGGVEPVALGVLRGGDGLGQLADAGPEIGKEPLELAAADADVGTEIGRVGRADEQVERLRERPVRRPHDGVAGAVEHERASGGRLMRELPNEPALPRAGLAADERDPPALAGRPGHQRPERRELARPAHEREGRPQPERAGEGRCRGGFVH